MWVKPGGLVLVTITESDEDPYTEDDFFGATMYWTNFSRSKYEAVFQDAGFQVLSVGVVGHGYWAASVPNTILSCWPSVRIGCAASAGVGTEV